MKTAEMCMNMNYFEFRGRPFKIDEGTSMSNLLSPFIAEAFMSNFEMNHKQKSPHPTGLASLR